MNDTSRRRFLGVVGAGAVTAGAATVLPDTALAQRGAAPLGERHASRWSPTSPTSTSDEVTLMVGEREVVVHDRDLVTRLLNAAGRLTMSSHREAPEISKDPVADNTDVYAFVSPDRPDTVTLIANFIPLQKPDGGPNFYEFGDDVLYEIHISNTGNGPADIIYQFRFHTKIRNTKTFLYNTGPINTHRRHRPGTGRSSTR